MRSREGWFPSRNISALEPPQRASRALPSLLRRGISTFPHLFKPSTTAPAMTFSANWTHTVFSISLIIFATMFRHSTVDQSWADFLGRPIQQRDDAATQKMHAGRSVLL